MNKLNGNRSAFIIFLTILYHGNVYSYSTKLLPEEELDVLEDVLQNNLNANESVLYINIDVKHANFLSVTLNCPEISVIVHGKFDAYVIMVNAKSNPEEIFSVITSNVNFNSHGKFIVLLFSDALKEIIETAARFYVYNLVIVRKDEFYTYSPFDGLNVNNFNKTPIVLRGNRTIDLFTNKLPEIWTNSTITIAIYTMPPFTILHNTTVSGIEIEILKILQSVLKFKIKYLNNFANWGMKTDGYYNNAYGSVQRKLANIGLGMFATDDITIQDFDMTISYITDNLVFVVPKYYKLKVEFRIEKYVWICLGVSYSIISFLWHYSSKNNTQLTFLVTFRILISNSLPRLPTQLNGRIVFIVWAIGCWIFMIQLQVYVMYFLTHDTYENEIETIYDLSRSNLKIGMFENIIMNFRDTDNPSEHIIYEKYSKNYCNLDLRCLNMTAFNQNLSVVRPVRTIQYYSSTLLNGKGDPLIKPVKEAIFMKGVNMCFTKGFPLYPRIDYLLHLIVAAGFVEYWDKWYENYISLMNNKNVMKSNQFNSKALTLHNLNDIFYILIYGWGLAIFIFIFECTKVRFKNYFNNM